MGLNFLINMRLSMQLIFSFSLFPDLWYHYIICMILSSCFYLVAKEWIPIQKLERVVAMFYQHSWYYILYCFCLGLVWLKCCLQTSSRGGHKETKMSKNFPHLVHYSALWLLHTVLEKLWQVNVPTNCYLEIESIEHPFSSELG